MKKSRYLRHPERSEGSLKEQHEIFFIFILFLFTLIYIVPCNAGMMNYYGYPNGLATATGIVKSTGRNTIVIFDEQEKQLEGFFLLDQRDQYKSGDYIRIYYHPKTAVVQTIKRMTVLEYKANGQNLGNILRLK